MKKPISLSGKFFLYSLILILLILSYVTFSLIAQRSEQNQRIIAILFSELAISEKIIGDSVNYTELVTKEIAKKISKSDASNESIWNFFQTYNNSFAANKIEGVLSVSMFSWVNSNNMITVNSEVGQLKDPVNVSNRDYLKLTSRHPYKLFQGKPVTGGVSRQYIIPLGMGVIGADGKYIGSIVVGITIDGLYNKFLVERKSEFLDMQIIYLGKESVIKKSFSLSKNILEKIDSNNNEVQILKYPSLFNDEVIIYKKFSDSYGIMLRVLHGQYLVDDYYSDFSYLSQLVTIILILLIFFFYLKRNFINPVLSLSDLIKDISTGKNDVEIPDYEIAEINNLSSAVLSAKQAFLKDKELYEKNLEIQRMKSERESFAKSKFLKTTSHDLKNYIFAIHGLCNLILDSKSKDEIDSDSDLKLVKTIANQTTSLEYFLEDLLNDKNVSLGDFCLGDLVFCDVNIIIKNLILLNKNKSEVNNISVVEDLGKNLPKLKCDIRRFEQILMNLIDNAIKYSNPNSTVKISTRYLIDMSQIYIAVEDSGIGMTEEEVQMIFSGEGVKIPKSGLKKHSNSHGIGLNNVLNLVKLHNANLQIKSSKGIGTKMELYFDAREQIADSEEIGIERKYKILNIDDNQVNLLITKKKIENNLSNVRCEIISSITNAISLLQKDDSYSLILLDLDMPEMDGVVAAKEIRKFNQSIPIIAYSTRGFEEVKDSIEKLEINAYVSKQSADFILYRNINKWILRNDDFAYFSDENLKSILEGKNVILADDSKVNIMIISRYLQSYGMIVHEAYNGEEMLESYKKNPNWFDFIVTDIEMPILRGDEAIKRIKQIDKKIPVIAITGNKNKTDINALLNIGVDDYFFKGSDLKYLVNMMVMLS